VRGGNAERPSHGRADGVVAVGGVYDVVLNLHQRVANADVESRGSLLIREQVGVLAEQGHRCTANDQEDGHGDHQFEQRESRLSRGVRSTVTSRVHGCTKLDWKVTGGFRLWLARVTRMVICRTPAIGVLLVTVQVRLKVKVSLAAAGRAPPVCEVMLPPGV